MLNFKIAILVLGVAIVNCAKPTWDLDECLPVCKTGSPSVIPGTSPSSNGCGSFGLQLNFTKYESLAGFTQCCNDHDKCYNTCNSDRKTCDLTFRSCLRTAVSTSSVSLWKKIQYYSVAELMYLAVASPIGCIAYILGFQSTCDCP